MVTVLIVDDEPLMRAGLRAMVDGVDGICVTGEAADGAEALTHASALDPDVVLMDVRMPGMSGIEAARELRDRGARAQVVMLTAFDADELLIGALRAGACSFLLKNTPPELLVRAIRDAADGTACFSPSILDRLVQLATDPRNADLHLGAAAGVQAGVAARPFPAADTVTPRSTSTPPGAAPILAPDAPISSVISLPHPTPDMQEGCGTGGGGGHGCDTGSTGRNSADAHGLGALHRFRTRDRSDDRRPAHVTRREWAVAQLVADGRTNAEIAAELTMSLPTVKTHLGKLFEKFQVTNRVQLAIIIIERTW